MGNLNYKFRVKKDGIFAEISVTASSRQDALEYTLSLLGEDVALRFIDAETPAIPDEIKHLYDAGFNLDEIHDCLYKRRLEKLYCDLAKYTKAMDQINARNTVKAIKALEKVKADVQKNADPDPHYIASFTFTQLHKGITFDDIERELDNDDSEGKDDD